MMLGLSLLLLPFGCKNDAQEATSTAPTAPAKSASEATPASGKSPSSPVSSEARKIGEGVSLIPKPSEPGLKEKIGKPVQRTMKVGEPIKVILGDVTGDGKLQKDDVTLAMDMVVNKVKPTKKQLAAADLNNDEMITIDEANAINIAFSKAKNSP